MLQTLDSLGAGFQLASHDLDIRGAGNLLGDEQSGHIREVGFELYQYMLEEAVVELRKTAGGRRGGGRRGMDAADHDRRADPDPREPTSPISTCASASTAASRELETAASIDAFAAELIDRFGPLPAETEQPAADRRDQALCREASVEKLDAGPKGAVVTFATTASPTPPASST